MLKYVLILLFLSACNSEKKCEDSAKYNLKLAPLYSERISAAKDVDVLFVGDSLMHIFEKHSNKEFPGSYNAGVGGSRTDTLVLFISELLKETTPKKVFISITGNDVLQSCDLGKAQDNRQLITLAIRNAGATPYFISIPPIDDASFTDAIKDQNKKMSNQLGAEYIEAFNKMYDSETNKIKAEYNGDGIHFNDKGYEDVWTPKIKNIIKPGE